MWTPRSAALIAAFQVVVLVAPLGLAAAQGADSIEELRKEAAEARSDLEKASKQLDEQKKDLARSQRKLRDTLKELGQAEAELNRIRGPLAQLANASYQQPGAAGSMVIFGGGEASQGLRTAADVAHMANDQDTLIKRADELHRRRKNLTTTAQELQSRNAVEQTKVQQEIQTLRTRSVQLGKQLTALLSKVSPERRLQLSCDKDLVSTARRFPNGLIPSKYLCPLPQKGEKLRADAALAFYKLNAAYKKRFGRDMCLTSSYRSYADQQRLYYSRPGFAAVPGRSNHGLGQAVDICGGVQNQGSVQFNWLRANSRTYGWFHPSWAYSSPFEPWHWEYGTSSD